MTVQRIDHIGVVVNDLAAAKAFFLALGLEVDGETEVAGEWVDRVVGLEGVRSAIVFMRAPGGRGVGLELTKFLQPAADEREPRASAANTAGIRHIAFAVDDIEATLARLKAHGAEPFTAVQRYEDVYKLCYVRGPEGIILELAERIRPS